MLSMLDWPSIVICRIIVEPSSGYGLLLLLLADFIQSNFSWF